MVLPVCDRNGSIVFGPGNYCLAKLLEKRDKILILQYLDGPFGVPAQSRSRKKAPLFETGAEFVDVPASQVHVELATSQPRSWPVFIVSVSIVQVAVFAGFSALNEEVPGATAPVAGLPILWLKFVGDPHSHHGLNADYPICSDLRYEAWRCALTSTLTSTPHSELFNF